MIELAPTPHEVLAAGAYDWYINDWTALSKFPKVFSPTFNIGKYSWRLLIFPQGNNPSREKSMSIFLECLDVRNQSDAICASFCIGAYNRKDNDINIVKDAKHRFNSTYSDWGFSSFIPIADLDAESGPCAPSSPLAPISVLSLKPSGIVQHNRFLIRVEIQVVKDVVGNLWINYDTFDSRKEVGFVGIKNQGATCYMNSLLQSLFALTSFKKMLFAIPTENEDVSRCIPLALQKFFYYLHTSPGPVSTKELTRSFGWDSYESFLQQDIQELKALLFDSLEAKLKGTHAEKDLDVLFQVKSMRYIKCLNVDYESKSHSTFYDIPLEIKGLPNLQASFEKYGEKEVFEGSNQYKADHFGYQDAVTGNVFTHFPPVLYLNLKRYEYDYMQDRICKVNDYYEFPETIDLSPYYHPETDADGVSQSGPASEQKFSLFGILVHAGDFGGGHYYAFLKNFASDKWLKFDDDHVLFVDKAEAIYDNYGDPSSLAEGSEQLERYKAMNSNKPQLSGLAARIKKLTSAYMLIYIRDKDIEFVLKPFSPVSDIPQSLVGLCQSELAEEEARKLQRKRDIQVQKVYIVHDEYLKTFSGPDLIEHYFLTPKEKSLRSKIRLMNGEPDIDDTLPMLEMQKGDTVSSLKLKLEKDNGIAREDQRIWTFSKRPPSGTRRVKAPVEGKNERTIILRDFADRSGELVFYLECGIPGISELQPLTEDSVLLFVKLYDPSSPRKLEMLGSVLFNGKQPLLSSDNSRLLHEKLQLPLSLGLEVFEEVTSYQLSQKSSTVLSKTAIKDAGFENGDILVVQAAARPTTDKSLSQSMDVVDYYQELSEKVIVTFKLNQSSDFNEKINDALAARQAACFKSPQSKASSLSDIDNEDEAGTFHIELKKSMSYQQVSEKLFAAVNDEFPERVVDSPANFAFKMYEPILGTCKSAFIPYSASLKLQDLLPKTRYMASANIIYYEILEMSLQLMELKRPLRLEYISKKESNRSSSKLLMLDQGDTFNGILTKFEVKLSGVSGGLKDELREISKPSGKYRILEVHPLQLVVLQEYYSNDCGIAGYDEAEILPQLTTGSGGAAATSVGESPIYHLEEIPADELAVLREPPSTLTLAEGSLKQMAIAVPVLSFFKDLRHSHSFPFKFLLLADEPVSAMKVRLRRRMQEALPTLLGNFSDKEWNQVKLVMISPIRPLLYLERSSNASESSDLSTDSSAAAAATAQSLMIPASLPWNPKTDYLGLDYPSKLSVAASPPERSLKIHN